MKAASVAFLFGVAAVATSGCCCVPVTEWNTVRTQNHSLAEQNQVQLSEIENLRTHCRELEDRVISSEKQLAAREERDGSRR